MTAVATSLLVVLLAVGLPVGVALGILAVILGNLYAFISPLPALGDVMWGASTDFLLTAVPMFILMGEILLRSGAASRMYEAVDPWVSRIPGGLMHTNIASCALFAATSGSSVATAATISTLAVPSMRRYGYNPPLFLGSLAAGGTLGILIPPSINMIIYGVLADVSVSDLYLAGVIPGLAMAGLFSLVVLALCLARPGLAGERRDRQPASLRGLSGLLPILFLFALVVGSIYAGLATPTEAAALGLIGALVIAMGRRQLSWALLRGAFEGTARTTAMVMFIVLAAYFLNFVMVNIGLTTAVTALVADLQVPPLVVLLAIVVLYLVLGCFMDTLSMMIATTPIVVPIVVQAGFDPLWFGIVFVILIEAALITPPVGMNLFIVQSVRGEGVFRDVVIGSLPFLAMMLVMIGLLVIWPGLALWLPSLWKGSA
ncbi:MAG: hypothetical protein CTY25_05040 [Methylobacterium sp.]|nr:MAG: hypothetical protein CTY25_05040 [Methylobacterium sp.]